MADDRTQKLKPSALTVEDAARLLGISEEMLRADLDTGAPTNADGTINLIQYAAWLNIAPPPEDVDAEH
ncbi:MAG: hypothetical protein R6V58_14680 [Planctomycetota bacterium]